MSKKSKLSYSLLALLAVSTNYLAGDALAAAVDQGGVIQAQESNQQHDLAADAVVAPKKVQAPILFEGEELSFDEATGAVYAKGNVKITQNDSKVTADEIHGNTKSSEVWVDGKAHITQLDKPSLDLNGYTTHYKYQAREGTMAKIEGRADNRYVKGEKLEFYPDEIIIYNGTMTKCPAKKPDYNMSAKKIEIWPDDKIIAYDAKFLVRNKVLYTTSRYEAGIGKNKEESAFPRVGYSSDDGVSVKQKFEHYFNDNVSAFADIGYYTKHDFKNQYGFKYGQKDYSLIAETGDYQDDDDVWIKKEPNFRFIYPNKKIGNLPLSYRLNAEYGKWDDDYKTSWHQEYEIYFAHDPIKLSDTINLYLGTGYEIIKESFDNSQRDTIKYDITLGKKFSPKLQAWTGYHYNKNNSESTLFNYDTADVGKELASGISYRFDNKNTMVVSQSYDVENGRTADMYYTWYRDLHCWQMELTYHRDYLEHDNSLKVKFNVTNW